MNAGALLPTGSNNAQHATNEAELIVPLRAAGKWEVADIRLVDEGEREQGQGGKNRVDRI